MIHKTTCKICGSTSTSIVAYLQPRWGPACHALRCHQCRFVWANPLPELTVEVLNQIYDQAYTEEIRRLEMGELNYEILYRATLQQMNKVERMCGGIGTAFNVGAMSLTSKVLHDLGWDLTVVEISSYAAQSARKLWGIAVVEGRIEDVVLPQNYFDFIKFSHVIEHLADPLLVLNKLYGTLKPGGILLVETDNGNGLKTTIEIAVRAILGERLAANVVSRLTGKQLNKRYGRLLPYEYISLFDKQSLSQVLEYAGLTVVGIFCPA